MKIRCEITPVGADTTPIIVTNDEDDSFSSRVYITFGDVQLKVRAKELIDAIRCCAQG